MPQISENSPQLATKSERVVKLLAACIRSAIRFRYAQTVSQTDAIDLARIHDLQSAMKTISEKMEVHRSLPDDQGRLKLAVAETKLVSETDLGTVKIVAVRRATIDALGSNPGDLSQRQVLLASLRIVQQEARLWAKGYSRFLTEIASLHKSMNARIIGLNLPTSVRLEVQSELEKLIVDAIRRAGEIDSSH